MCKPFILLTVLLLFIFVSSFIMGTILHSAPIGIEGKATVNHPYYFHDSSVRWGEITDFAACEDILYILFGSKEVLDCYSMDGTYLHSYSIKLEDKGKAALFVSDGILYLKSKGFTFYTFCDGLFVESYDVLPTELYAEITRLSANKGEVGEYTYKLCGSSIWQSSQENSKEIVHRPGWMVVFQGGLILLIGSISFITLCLILYYYKKRV